jgi:hypothetical protein
MSTALFVVLDSRIEPSGPVLVPPRTQARPKAVIAIARSGGVSFSIKDAAASTVVCSRPARGEEAPWRRLLRLQAHECRVAAPGRHARTRPGRRIFSQIQRVSSAERIRSRADERSWSGVQETIPRSARQRVRLTACDLRPAARDPRVREESAERLPDPPQDPVHRRHERRETQRPEDPREPASRRKVLEQADPRRSVHHPNSGGLDQLPGRLDLGLGNARGKRRGRLLVATQERKSPPPIQPGDEPRRRAAERSAAVEEQERAGGRWNVTKPRRAEHIGIDDRNRTDHVGVRQVVTMHSTVRAASVLLDQSALHGILDRALLRWLPAKVSGRLAR